MTRPLTLFQVASAVSDEESFLGFIEALRDDRSEEAAIEATHPSNPYGPGALGWENGSIEAFLDAASAWGRATAHATDTYAVPENPWRRAAQIICAGKFYE